MIVYMRHLAPSWPTVSCRHTLANITVNNTLVQCLVQNEVSENTTCYYDDRITYVVNDQNIFTIVVIGH